MTRQAPLSGRKKFILGGLICAVGLAALCVGVLMIVSRENSGVSLPSSANIDAAIASDQRTLSLNPDDLKALTDLGLRYYLKGPNSYPEAINVLEDALNLGALDARIYYCLGIMYQNLGLYPFALDDYQRYLRNYPNDEPIALLAAKLLYQSGRYEEAAEEYGKIAPRDPKNPIALENLALSLWKSGKPQDALDALSRMSALDQASAARAAFDAAQIHFGLKRYDDAADDLARAQAGVGAAPEDVPAPDFYRLLARTSQKLGRLEQAADARKKLREISPKDSKKA